MLPLFAGAALLLVAVVLGVVAATSLLVERQRLYALADATAIYASESFDPSLVTREGPRSRAPLSSAVVRTSALKFLARVGDEGVDSLRLESAGTPDGWHAEVSLSSLWSPPVISYFFPDGLRIEVDSRAQTFLR
ncbi:MAG: hypothetical protein ACO35C_04980 [Pontimonas sp.]